MNKVPYASVRPTSSLNLLSHREVEGVMNYDDEVFKLFRQCALAVLNTGMQEDDADAVFNYFHDFDIRIIPQSRGIKLDVVNAPANAFVNTHHKIFTGGSYSSANSDDITDTVFRILRNAGILKANTIPRLVVCWGGHAIKRHEYEYSKQVGYELGIRGLNIATGCGTGAMRGPMKGAAVGHAKQQIRDGRYIGITEPGIIASESPNPTVSELVILPDIEKRLEAFVRLSHSIIVFPGGAGTVEEILYLLSLLMHPDNRSIDIPVIFAAPIKSKEYFSTLDNFICNTLGKEAREFYQIVIGEPERVAQKILEGVDQVQRHRRRQQESYSFNWQLKIPMELQTPFHPSHENMRQLKLHYQQPKHALAAQMRCGFSGIVAGNIKAEGVEAVRKHGPYILQGDSFIIKEFDVLLKDFIANGRMKLKDDYKPCYRLDE
jgi:predicted Rossmann-fold nucleotide-binding protein